MSKADGCVAALLTLPPAWAAAAAAAAAISRCYCSTAAAACSRLDSGYRQPWLP
jgi:hypothetical protein